MAEERKPKRQCAICGKELRGNSVALEYNNRTDTWHEPGTVPPADSQGAFEVGVACARAAIKRATEG